LKIPKKKRKKIVKTYVAVVVVVHSINQSVTRVFVVNVEAIPGIVIALRYGVPSTACGGRDQRLRSPTT
jgi:thiamine transporter ThiT